jgi:RNA polymerase sigma factor (sigma-70 family)
MLPDPAYPNIHQKLINKCRKGDRKAQFEIYRLYYKSMYNTSLRIVKDPQEAEDIMQESFLSAFRKIETYRGKVSFGAWLKKIVINNSLDVVKKKKLFFEELNEDYTQLALKEEVLNEELLAQQAELIREGIQKLPDGYRIILSLHLLEGYDHEEIAEILNISSSTSRSQFFRAKQRLIRLLEKM